MILRRRSDHAGAADVDVLDGVRDGDVGLCDRFFERVQIHDDQLERDDPVLNNRRQIGLQIGPSQDRSVHFRVQRLHATVHDFRETGVAGDVLDRDPCLFERPAGAARRNQLKPKAGKTLREFGEAGFVADADEGSAGKVTHGSEEICKADGLSRVS